MLLTPTYIEAVDIPDAWFLCLRRLQESGRKYVVQRGSYEGETRLQFDHIVVHIRFPYAEPYDRMLPEIPAYLNIPNPVAYGYVEQYLPYLMTNTLQPGESYTYGSRIHNQIDYWIGHLKVTPNTNQAVLQVADPADYILSDPPCLREIGLQIINDQLIFYPSFRSWDLWGGFPSNLAGLAVVQKYMADRIGVDSGPMIATSKGLHVYGYAEEMMKIRTNVF